MSRSMAGSLVLATQDFTGRTNASYFPKVWQQVALGEPQASLATSRNALETDLVEHRLDFGIGEEQAPE
jgi:hypothetical protein